MAVDESLPNVPAGPDVVRVGLLGYGNVGVAFTRLIDSQAEAIALRTGLELRVTRIAVRDLDRSRPGSPRSDAGDRLCIDPGAIVEDPEIDVIVELVGGIEPARSLVLAALAVGKPVVTANKELLLHLRGRASRCGRKRWRGPFLRGLGGWRHPARARCSTTHWPVSGSLA